MENFSLGSPDGLSFFYTGTATAALESGFIHITDSSATFHLGYIGKRVINSASFDEALITAIVSTTKVKLSVSSGSFAGAYVIDEAPTLIASSDPLFEAGEYKKLETRAE